MDPFTYDTPELPKTVSLYEQLFNNPSVLNPVDPVLASGPSATEEIKNHIPAILAAFQTSADDLALLTDKKTAQDTLQLSTSEVADTTLTLDNLSHLYRATSLSKALDLSLVDFLSAKALTGIDPFQSTGHTLRFVAAVRKIGASPFSIEDLDYLLRHAQRPSSNAVTSRAQINMLLDGIYGELKKLDPTGEITKGLLGGFLKPEDVEQAMSLISDTSVPTAKEQKERTAFIGDHFKDFMSEVADASDRLVRTGDTKEKAIKDKAERFAYVLANLLTHVERKLSEPLVTQVIQPLVGGLGLESTILSDLLFKFVQPDSPPLPGALAVLLEGVVLMHAPEPDPDARQRLHDLHTLLSKIARITNGYGMTAGELRWIFMRGPARGWLDLNNLPLKVADKSPDQFLNWERLDDVFSLFDWERNLREETQPGTAALFQLFEEGDSAAKLPSDPKTVDGLRKRLATLTRWQLTDETVVAVSLIKNLAEPKSYTDERGLLPLRDCFDIAARTGLSPKQLRELCGTSVSTDQAIAVMQAIHAGYKDGLLLSAIRPLSDVLREKHRSALVSYLVFHLEFRHADDLFGHYLIDVEMSACQLTSRIKQAISSVQLFIQRVLMNLEKGVSVPPERARLWKWMKNYRVWEANRKVFLYPENWIEPDLRDDKTPFFKDLENDLLQGEVTADAVESAYSNYLDQLDQVARLEICGFYHERPFLGIGIATPDIMHVFGRTQGIPHVYYYRRREERHWTAWERVDADIEGDHLIPVVYEGRLHLFWAITTQKTKGTGEPPPSYWEVQLAWSTYHNNSWSAKKVSETSIALDELLFFETELSHVEKNDLFFKTVQVSDGLSIRLYVYRRDLAASLGKWPLPSKEEGEFRIESCRAEIVAHGHRVVEMLPVPRRTEIHNMSFAEDPDGSSDQLYLVQQSEKGGTTTELDTLRVTPGRFSLVTPHQDLQFNSENPFFFQDQTRGFFVTSDPLAKPKHLPGAGEFSFIYWLYLFETFYHPYTCEFIKPLNRLGIEGLLNPIPKSTKPTDRKVTDLSRQQMRDLDVFANLYKPNSDFVKQPYPVEDIDFQSAGAYSQYNWELFFHIPLMIADRLSENQRFEEAQQWFHYIFDPTDSSPLPTPQRFWKIRPFFENMEVKHTIAKLLELLDLPLKADDPLQKEKDEFIDQVEKWMRNPFNPHLIARLRIAAYQKTVVMKYIDNLIAWGDQLFRRDTIESINEATQLYVLAAAILGDRPMDMPAHELKVRTFGELASHLDTFSNSVVEIEGYLAAPKASKSGKSPTAKAAASKRPEELEGLLAMGQTLYFCTPQNDQLLRYWDTVADRLFKVRHCMNIEGVVRQLPLFEPPIDPALLVRATAAGLDLSSILSDLNLALPNYRFTTMLQKAVEFCNDVKGLGAALLSALEKKDAEDLTRLRSGQEIQLLNAVRQNKQKQVEEAQHALDALQKSKEMATLRHDYYSSREFMNDWEKAHRVFLAASELLQGGAAYLETSAAVLHSLPETAAGTTGVTVTFGGIEIGMSLDSAARALGSWSSVANIAGSMSATMGSYERRKDEWKLQEDLAAKELEQVDKQILGAEIRKAIAEQDLKNHELQIKHAKEVDARMRSKFTNRELYSWMISQISAVHFQSYQMAYDIAKRAEKCYMFELGKQGNSDPGFLQPPYWDSLKKGLLAGERLLHDLRRMEAAYLDENKREYEITKSISLAMLDPLALVNLKQNGVCFVDLPEDLLFDMDYPGHYLRRIKSVSLTIPCITGPYTSVNCTLTLMNNSVRATAALRDGKYAREKTGDPRFVDYPGAIQSIATSSGQNDSGVYELNFRDERYLPFEGWGAISRWQIEMPKNCNQFDFNTISDVILHLRYTARDGGKALKDAALNERLEKGMRLFSARHDFSSDWHRFLHPSEASPTKQTLQLDLTAERFPLPNEKGTIRMNRAELFLKLRNVIYDDGKALGFDLQIGSGEFLPQKFQIAGSSVDTVPHSIPSKSMTVSLGSWIMEFKEETIKDLPASLRRTVNISGTDHFRLNPDAIEDIWIICEYSI
jgi:hypothetical protein